MSSRDRHPPERLAVGMLQMAISDSLEENREKIVRTIVVAKQHGCRLAIFPEGSLDGPPEGTSKAALDRALGSIATAAAENSIYVIMGLRYRERELQPPYNCMVLFGPTGESIFRYNKLFDSGGTGEVPGAVEIDGIPLHITICADRWLRGVQELPVMAGSKITVEIANNFANEWIEEAGWFRYVPLALRTGTYVVFCNSSDLPSWYPAEPGLSKLTFRDLPQDSPLREVQRGHGHSAVIRPDGTFVFQCGTERDEFRVTILDLEAVRETASERRRNHPVLSRFWDAGLKTMRGERFPVPKWEPLRSTPGPIALAVAQVAVTHRIDQNLRLIEELAAEASRQGAELAVFPELSLTGASAEDIEAATARELKEALSELRSMAVRSRISVVVGMPWAENGRRTNSAFAIDSMGRILTRYDQLVVERTELFDLGASAAAMWFCVAGKWAVITIGSDSAWDEIAELAAMRGAQLHCHICNEINGPPNSRLIRSQRWMHMAQYRTVTLTVNAADPLRNAGEGGGSAVWDDVQRSGTDPGDVELFVPYQANRVVSAGPGHQLLCVTRHVEASNPHYRTRVVERNPQMKSWFAVGISVIGGNTE